MPLQSFTVLLAAAAEETGGTLFNLGTFVLQMVNFLTLVVLLRIFLYPRVVKAMDQRAKKIASHFEAAEEKEKEAAERASALEEQKKDLDDKRDGLLKAAADEAEARRRELTDKARTEVAAIRARWSEDLERQKKAFLEEMSRNTGEAVCAATRRALEDLADAELERRMVAVLAARLEGMAEDESTELVEALADSGNALVVATSWEATKDDQAKITDAVHKHVSKDAKVTFDLAPELACGIELRAGGREISWTIASYVDGLNERLASAIDAEVKSATAPEKPAPIEATEKPTAEVEGERLKPEEPSNKEAPRGEKPEEKSEVEKLDDKKPENEKSEANKPRAEEPEDTKPKDSADE
jgi:F-type H+-transporting ATPase subunit b